MNEKIKGINPVPLLSGTYNKDNDGVGSVFSDISPSSDNLNEETGYADTLIYTITIEDGESNDGILELDLIAFDRSGTQVSIYGDSPQKVSTVSSNIALARQLAGNRQIADLNIAQNQAQSMGNMFANTAVPTLAM